MRPARALYAALAALIAGFGVGGCGSSGAATTTATRTQPAATLPAPTTGTSSTPAAPTTSTPATTPGQASTPACVAPMLALSEIGNQGATGHIEVGLGLRNTSSGSCHTFGYPGVLFLGKTGQSLPTTSTRTTNDFAGHVPLRELVVAPGQTVSFRLLFEDSVGGSGAGCTTAYGVQVIPPDDTHTLRTSIADGVTECGTTTVSPLAPGTSAYR